jgi:protein involved in polysaccharide export with SLBB domain
MRHSSERGCVLLLRRILPGALGITLGTWGPVQAQAGAQSVANISDSALALRPGDTVRLRIWREPDLSGDFPVNESGIVVLPKLGPRRVIAENPDSFKAWVVHSYAELLRNPSIEVLLVRRVQVLGAVRNPGLYPIEPTMTVADAIALAGGTTPQGRSDKVELRRQGERVPGKLSGRLLIGESPIRSGDQIYVPERSWISRNPGIVIGVLGLVTTVIIRVAR